MKYSNLHDECVHIVNIENDVSRNINDLCNDFAGRVMEWGNKINSELVYIVCKKTIEMIDEDYINLVMAWTTRYINMDTSFINISKRLHVGEEAFAVVNIIEQEVIDKANSHKVNEISRQYVGNVEYSDDLILEYSDLISNFKLKIEQYFDQYYNLILSCSNDNVLYNGLSILVKYQYEILQSTVALYDNIFTSFLIWYKRNVQENQMLIEEIKEQVLQHAEQMSEDEIINGLLVDILGCTSGIEEPYFHNDYDYSVSDIQQDNGIATTHETIQNEDPTETAENNDDALGTQEESSPSNQSELIDDNASGSDINQVDDNSVGEGNEENENPTGTAENHDYTLGTQGESSDSNQGEVVDENDGSHINYKGNNTLEDSANEALNSIAHSMIDDLESAGGVDGYIDTINDCQNAYNSFENEEDKSERKKKFKELSRKIIENAKKYAKPTMKALSMIAPLIAPVNPVASKIMEKLPAIMECFSGKENNENDAEKIGLGLDCIKAIGIDKIPQTDEGIEEYIKKNGQGIANEVLNKVLSSDKYRKEFGISDADLNRLIPRGVHSSSVNKDCEDSIGTDKIIDSDMNEVKGRNPYDYDFEFYNPKTLNKVRPKLNDNMVKEMSDKVRYEIPKILKNNDFETILSEISDFEPQIYDGSKEYLEIPRGSKTEKLLDGLNRTINDIGIGDSLKSNNGKYNKDDIKCLVDEFNYEKNKAEKNGERPDYCNACRNFMKRYNGYPAADDDIVIIKDIRELIPVIDGRYKEFRTDNTGLLNLIDDAQSLFTSRRGGIKCKVILNALSKCALGAGCFLGIGALLAMSATWPLAVLVSLIPLASLFYNDDSRAYSILVYNLGDRRVDFLLGNYIKKEDNYYMIKENND